MAKKDDIIEPIDASMDDVSKALMAVPPHAPPVDNSDPQWSLLPLIEHKVEAVSIDQRANDGYINATAVCKASGKLLGHYLETKATKAFLKELSADIGIPISDLVQIIKGGHPQMQGTWVHPQVAINLGQWASPKFAVLVSKWTFEWMSGSAKEAYQFPYHIRRYLINRSKIPATHFSMLDQMTFKLLGALESKGYVIPAKLMPDISLGRIFSGWLRDKGYDPDSFPSYPHDFDDGKRPTVQARLYPNDLMTDFNHKLDEWITSGEAMKYFKKRDPDSVKPMQLVYEEIKALESTKLIENKS
ncbi:KilA-N domain-containing protein [Parasphingorhabdus sp.]|uniref:KilA-N domain-containing protein n=1 Tax=Parasphingorhabdus sp. TaxID=2709688 RepID=UPI003A8D62AF